MAKNDGIGNPVADPFPGISLPGGTGAPGSAGDRTPPPDDDVPGGQSGLPGVGTEMPLSFQAGLGSSASTSQPGQTAASVISPGPAADYSDTGAGKGASVTNEPHGRYPWQQPAGGT